MTLQSSAFRFFRYNRLDNCRGGGTADLPFEISLTRSRVEKRRMNLHTRTVMIDYARLLLFLRALVRFAENSCAMNASSARFSAGNCKSRYRRRVLSF